MARSWHHAADLGRSVGEAVDILIFFARFLVDGR